MARKKMLPRIPKVKIPKAKIPKAKLPKLRPKGGKAVLDTIDELITIRNKK
jgi:hypothetical protein